MREKTRGAGRVAVYLLRNLRASKLEAMMYQPSTSSSVNSRAQRG